MDINPQNNDENFFQKNQNYIIAAIIVILLVVYFIAQRPKDTTEERTENEQEQTDGVDEDAMSPELLTGITVKNGKVLGLWPDNQTAELEYNVTLTNGTQVTKTGEIIKADGSKSTLKEGETIGMDGVIVRSTTNNTSTNNGTQKTDTMAKDITSTNGNLTLTGKLQKSNSSKGNLLLISDGHYIYIKTSRDFSSLIGKEVTATGTGTMESFRMSDIQEKK
jgi:hypothetical protein